MLSELKYACIHCFNIISLFYFIGKRYSSLIKHILQTITLLPLLLILPMFPSCRFIPSSLSFQKRIGPQKLSARNCIKRRRDNTSMSGVPHIKTEHGNPA